MTSERKIIRQQGRTTLEEVHIRGLASAGFVLRDPSIPGGARTFEDRQDAIAVYEEMVR